MNIEGDKVQQAFEKALEELPEEVANIVRQKYKEDEEEFISAAKEESPFNTVFDAASSSCKHCYGRGFIGYQVDPKTHKAVDSAKVTCRCTFKNYKKWLKDFRIEFNDRKKGNVNEAEK